MSVTREFDLIINAGTTSPLIINANQNDSGETWKFNLFQDDGTKVVPTAGQIVGLKSDGHAIVRAGTVNSSGQVVITETAQMTAAPGANVYEIVFDSVHGTANFILLVEKSPVDDDADLSESDISAINQAIQMGIDAQMVNILNQRVENLITSQPEQAEVTDIRVGYDGTTYPTAGDAVRGQVSDLNQALNSSLVPNSSLNLFDVADGQNKNGYGLSSTDGSEVVSTNHWITGFIPIPPNTNIVANYAPLKVCYYDSNKSWLKTSSTGNVYYTIPTDVTPSYFRMQFVISNLPYKSDSLIIIGNNGTKQKVEQTKAHRKLNQEYVFVDFPDYDEISRIMQTADFWTYADWEIGSISSSTGNNTDNTMQYVNRLKAFVKLFAGCVITAKTGYRFKIFKYDEFGNFLSTNAWVNNGSWTVDETGYYRLIFGTYPVDASYVITESDFENLICQGQIAELLYPHENYTGVVTGEKINLTEQGYYTELINANIPSHSPKSLQASDIYDGKVFQLYSLNKLAIFNLSDGAELSYTDINCAHGNSCQFTNVFNESGDVYPLLCCFAYENDFVYLNKINADGTTTLIKTYTLAEIGAYRHSGGISKDGKRLYSISYHQNSSTDETDNYCVMAIWDLENSTEQDGVLKPVLLKQVRCDFIPIIQGCKYHYGKLFVSSGNYPDFRVETTIYAIDSDGNIVSRINDFPTGIYNRECESVSIYNGELIIEVTTGFHRIVLE